MNESKTQSASVESCGAVVRRAWENYLSALCEYQDKLRAINADFANANPPSECETVSIATPYKLLELKEEVARGLRARLIECAVRDFAAPGMKLQIDDKALEAAMPIVHRRNRPADDNTYTFVVFDPEADWAWLERRYGGNKGKKESLRQVSAALAKAFSFFDKPQVMKSGYAVFGIGVYMDSVFPGKLHYRSADEVRAAFQALRGFAVATDRLMLRAGLEQWLHGHSGNIPVTSRETFRFGDRHTELLVVTYQTRFEFRLRADAAEAVQMFLGSHLQRAAAA